MAPTIPLRRPLLLSLIALVLLGCAPTRPAVHRFVGGLNQPRGLIFDRQGNLLVAETGQRSKGAARGSSGDINHSGRVLRISPQGWKTTLVEGLPYTYYAATGDVGTTDLALIGGDLYVLTAEGYDDALSRKVLRVGPAGSVEVVADILQFALAMATGVEQVIGSVTSNPYAMVPAPDGSALFVSDGASGRILRIGLDGTIRVHAEFAGMPPLTGLAFDRAGTLHVAQFALWPHGPGSGSIWAVSSNGQLTPIVEGVTMPIDIEFDAAGNLYVLEFADGRDPNHPYAPESGRLIRIEDDGGRSVLADQLNYPTGLVFSEKQDLYIALNGAFTNTAQGIIQKHPCHTFSPSGPCSAATPPPAR